MIFDPVRRRKLSDYGGHEQVFLLHSAYARSMKDVTKILKETARKSQLLEEDINLWVAPLAKQFLFPRHILIDLYDGLSLAAEVFASESSDLEAGDFDTEASQRMILDALQSYPYVCLLPDWKKALNENVFYVDSAVDESYVVVTYVGRKGVYSKCLLRKEVTSTSPQALVRFFSELSDGDFTGAEVVKVTSTKQYSFVPQSFVLYNDLKKEVNVVRGVFSFFFVSVLLSLYLVSSGFSFLREKAAYEEEANKLTLSIQVLERRVALLPPEVKNQEVKAVVSRGLLIEDLLKKLPGHVIFISRPPQEVKPLLLRFRGQKFVLIQISSKHDWMQIKEKIPEARLLADDIVVLPL